MRWGVLALRIRTRQWFRDTGAGRRGNVRWPVCRVASRKGCLAASRTLRMRLVCTPRPPRAFFIAKKRTKKYSLLIKQKIYTIILLFRFSQSSRGLRNPSRGRLYRLHLLNSSRRRHMLSSHPCKIPIKPKHPSI